MKDQPVSSSPLRIVKEKVDLRTGEAVASASWDVVDLGVDEHGTWVGARRGDRVVLRGGRAERQGDDGVWLLPDDQHWVAAFWLTESTDLTIDVSLPPRLTGATWSFTELDLYRNARGGCGIVDQDEFQALAAAGVVSGEVLAVAAETADQLLGLVTEGVEPFGDAARARLAALRRLP